jgi:hypothetical protein
MKNLDRFIYNRGLIERSLEKTKKFYKYHPGWYLYKKIVSETNLENKFTDKFIELVYITLIAWNMNSRSAKLANYNTFKNSLKRHKKYFTRLSNCRLEQLSDVDLHKRLEGDARYLFSHLKLVADSKPRLVTYSKTFHFFLPQLFVPIDRKYTLTYFYGHSNIPKDIKLQYKRLSNILEKCRIFAKQVDLSQFYDENEEWNANIPKTIDNIIIGYQR